MASGSSPSFTARARFAASSCASRFSSRIWLLECALVARHLAHNFHAARQQLHHLAIEVVQLFPKLGQGWQWFVGVGHAPCIAHIAREIRKWGCRISAHVPEMARNRALGVYGSQTVGSTRGAAMGLVPRSV